MQQIKMAAPLFILREEAEKDLFAVLERLAQAGFDGVEMLGFFGREPGEIRRKLESLDMVALGNHVPADQFAADPQGVIKAHKELGCSYLTIAWPDRSLRTGCQGFGDMVNVVKNLALECLMAGIRPQYHNHDFEFLGQEEPMLDAILDTCREAPLYLEPDLGWMLFAGASPAGYLIKYKELCKVIHWKDLYASDLTRVGESSQLGDGKGRPEKGHFEFRPVGYGILNAPALMPLAMACDPDWMVMDHDCAYERDSIEDLKLSLDYVKSLLAMQ